MKKKILAWWDKILDLYFNDSSVSEAWRERVERLLAEELFEEEKSAALKRHFDKMVRYDLHPDTEVGKRLQGIKEELGFSGKRLKGDSVQVELLIGSKARVPERAAVLSTPIKVYRRLVAFNQGPVGVGPAVSAEKKARHAPIFKKFFVKNTTQWNVYIKKTMTPIKTNFFIMKTKIFTIAALAATTLLASCVKDHVQNVVKEGEATYMALSFSVPAGPKTRATTDQNASEAEAAFKFVDIFIYNPSTGMQVKHDRIPSDYFTGPEAGANSDDWTYSSSTKIATTTGVKKIVVGVNLSPAVSASLVGVSLGEFTNISQSVDVADVTGTTDGFAMFSTKPVDVTLVKETDSNYATENHPTIQVQRLVAKVTVQKAENMVTVAAGTIDNLMFELNNTNKKTFYIQPENKKDHNWATTPAGDLSDLNTNYVLVNNHDVTVKNLTPKYALENTTQDFLMGQITRATVRGTFVPAQVKEYYNSTDNTDGYKDVDVTTGTPAATFYSVSYNMGANRAYFFDLAIATDFAADNFASVITYTNGYCYWDMFLNPDNNPSGEEDMGGPYDVLRNDFYRCNITKIIGPGRATAEVERPTLPPSVPTDLLVDIQILYWNPIVKDYVLEP